MPCGACQGNHRDNKDGPPTNRRSRSGRVYDRIGPTAGPTDSAGGASRAYARDSAAWNEPSDVPAIAARAALAALRWFWPRPRSSPW